MSHAQSTEFQEAQSPKTAFTLIPLHKLTVSPQNIRRTDRKADLDALAASIRFLGLLQNLSVTRGEGDRFLVVAGGRRLAALKALAKQGVLAKDYPVPCHVLESVMAVESSLAENVQRVSADAMDEVEAFAALQEQGMDPQAIAQRFGCTSRHVAQRLALAALSPKLKAAYRKGDLSLDAARAFCLEPDPSRQEAVFKVLAKPVIHAGNVRAHLTHGRMRGTDRLARFVGLEAYEAAGGSLSRDLFLDQEVYIDDPALLARLAEQKLDRVREDLTAKGWGWVQVNLGHGRFEGASSQRLQPTRRPATEEEAAALARLDGEIAALEEALEEADEDDPRWGDRDRLEAEQANLRDSLTAWNPDEMALAGVVLSVEHDGRLFFSYGVIAKADAGKLAKLRRQRDADASARLRRASISSAGDALTESIADGAEEGGDKAEGVPWEEPRPSLPRGLVRDLTAIRTTAIRRELLIAPQTALAIGVFALLRHAVSGYGAPGISLTARPRWLADHDGLDVERIAWIGDLPQAEKDILDWCLAQDVETLLGVFAHLVASNIDFTHEDAHIEDRRKQAVADQIAEALNLDMRGHWTPDFAFWTRLPKAALIAALAEAPSVVALPEGQRSAYLKRMGKTTKADLAAAVAKALESAEWLPELLITPGAEPSFEVTDEGLAALQG